MEGAVLKIETLTKAHSFFVPGTRSGSSFMLDPHRYPAIFAEIFLDHGLCARDLEKCARVSKSWNSFINHYLWKSDSIRVRVIQAQLMGEINAFILKRKEGTKLERELSDMLGGFSTLNRSFPSHKARIIRLLLRILIILSFLSGSYGEEVAAKRTLHRGHGDRGRNPVFGG